MKQWIAVIGMTAVALVASAGAMQQTGPKPAGTTGTDANVCDPLLNRFNTMVTRMEQSQARLERQMAQVRAATGEQRIAAMTDVLAELVDQREQALQQLRAIDAPQIARLMQQTAGGSVACQVLTPLPLDPTPR